MKTETKNLFAKLSETLGSCLSAASSFVIAGAVLLGSLTIGSTASLAQGVPPPSTYGAYNINLPPGLILTPGQSTNLASGWTTITSVTNTSGPIWNGSTSVLITNIFFITNTTYADILIPNQKDLGLFFSQNAGIGTNTIAFGRLLDSTTVDTNAFGTLNLGQTFVGPQTGSTNISSGTIGGFGGVRILSITWTAASGNNWTNATDKYGRKTYAF